MLQLTIFELTSNELRWLALLSCHRRKELGMSIEHRKAQFNKIGKYNRLGSLPRLESDSIHIKPELAL